MQNKWSKWFVGLTMMAALLVGLTTLAGAPFSGAGNPQSQYQDGPPSVKGALAKTMTHSQAITYEQGRQAFLSNKTDMNSPKGLPKLPFQKPVAKMVAKAMQMAGRPASEVARAESLCNANVYWMGGPTYRTATNGTAVVWSAGSDLYFAAASNPSQYVTAGLGDLTWAINFYGNTVLVFGEYNTYIFDVTTPTNPQMVGMLYYVGHYWGYRDVCLTPDGQYALALDQAGNYNASSDPAVEAFDVASGNFISQTNEDYNTNNFHYLTSIIAPADGNGNGNIAIAADWSTGLVHFFDISQLSCGVAPTDMYAIESQDVLFGVGIYKAGYLMYQAPYLYFSVVPKVWYHPGSSFGPLFNTMGVGIIQIPDLTNPINYLIIKGYLKAGDDLVSMQPAGNGEVALGTFQDHVFLMDAQFNTVMGFGTYGTYVDDVSPCSDFMWDMGWSSSYGTVATDSRGMQSFDPSTWAQTGQVLTGGWSQSVLQSGNYLLVASGAGGLVILDNSTGTPTFAGQIYPTKCSSSTSIEGVYLVAASADGNTAYVSEGDNLVYVIDITDKTHPVLVNYFETHDTDDISFMGVSQGYLWLATTGSHLEEWGLAGYPQSPYYFQSVPLAGPASGKIVPLSFGAWPASTLLAVVESGHVDVVDITDASTTMGGPGVGPYVAGTVAVGNNDNYALAQNGNYLYLTNENTKSLYTIEATPGPTTMPVTFSPALTLVNTLGFASGPGNVVTEFPNVLAVLGSFPGVTGYGLIQFSLANPAVPSPIPSTLPPSQQFAFNPTFNGFYDVTPVGSAFAWADSYAGIGMFNVNPDFVAPSVDTLPSTTLNAYSRLQGTVTLTAAVHDAQTGIDTLTWYVSTDNTPNMGWQTGVAIGSMGAAIPAGGTPVPVSFQWNTTGWPYGYGPWYIWVVETDGGCNTTAAVSSDSYGVNLNPRITSISSPTMPSYFDPCSPAGSWIVCGSDLEFTVSYSDPTNNAPNGVTQVIAYVDGQQYGLPSNNVSGVVTFTIDTTQLTDGPHYAQFRVVDAAGLSKMSKKYWFTVHNVGPSVYVVQPVSGDVVSGPAITLSAHVVASPSSPGIAKVYFFLDPANPSSPSFTSDQIIGIATSQDSETGNWIAGTPWDATSTPYGNHIIVAVAREIKVNITDCAEPGISPLVSFRLIQYTPPTLSATATPTSGNIPLSVAFAANVSNGIAPYTYAWDFGDGNTASGQAVTHTYATAGTYNWTVTVTDGQGNTASANGSITAINPITPPSITGVSKASNPFRLKVSGSNFQSGAVVKINGTSVTTVFKSGSLLVAKQVKSLCPKGTAVQVTVTNPDGGVSTAFSFTR